jgi:hypothetical protein
MGATLREAIAIRTAPVADAPHQVSLAPVQFGSGSAVSLHIFFQLTAICLQPFRLFQQPVRFLLDPSPFGVGSKRARLLIGRVPIRWRVVSDRCAGLTPSGGVDQQHSDQWRTSQCPANARPLAYGTG